EGVCGVVVGVCGEVVAGGVSGACDDATTAKQSSMSAELLNRSKRLLPMDIRRRSSQNLDPPRRKTAPRAGSAQPRWRESRAAWQLDVRRWEVRVLGRGRVA